MKDEGENMNSFYYFLSKTEVEVEIVDRVIPTSESSCMWDYKRFFMIWLCLNINPLSLINK